MRTQNRSVLREFSPLHSQKVFLAYPGEKGVWGGITVAGGKTAGCSGLSWVDLTSNVSYFCWPVWDKWGGGENSVSSHLHSALCPQVKCRDQELSVIPREKAQSSFLYRAGAAFCPQQSTTMLSGQRKRVPKLKMFCVIYPVTSLWRVPGFAFQWFLTPWLPSLRVSPSSPSGVSLLSRFPFRTERLVRSHLWPEQRGSSGAEGRVRACGSVRRPGAPSRELVPVISRWKGKELDRALALHRSSSSVSPRQSNWFQGILFIYFLR